MGEFDHYRALSFDCYGTLINWESGIISALSEWSGRSQTGASDDELLTHFSEIETVVEGESSPALLYPQVLAETLNRMGDRFSVEVSQEDGARFGASVGDWPAFPDSPSALARLKQHFKLIIVSNVDRASFAASNQRLGVVFDRVITAEDVGAYKPNPPHFEGLFAALPELDVDRSELLHVAQSLFHDHEPARRYGLETVWIDRRAGRRGTGATPAVDASAQPRWRFPSLAEFADAVEGRP